MRKLAHLLFSIVLALSSCDCKSSSQQKQLQPQQRQQQTSKLEVKVKSVEKTETPQYSVEQGQPGLLGDTLRFKNEKTGEIKNISLGMYKIREDSELKYTINDNGITIIFEYWECNMLIRDYFEKRLKKGELPKLITNTSTTKLSTTRK